MAATVRKRSRLRFYDLVFVEGTDGAEYEFWDQNELPEIPVGNDDTKVRVKSTDRLDLLAYQFYGDPILWWVIAAANDIELAQTQLNEGDVIRIPSPNYVQQELFKNAVF
jgi:nucleoid-associated protein YgaU